MLYQQNTCAYRVYLFVIKNRVFFQFCLFDDNYMNKCTDCVSLTFFCVLVSAAAAPPSKDDDSASGGLPVDPIQSAMGNFGRWHAFVFFVVFLLKFPVAWHQVSEYIWLQEYRTMSIKLNNCLTPNNSQLINDNCESYIGVSQNLRLD